MKTIKAADLHNKRMASNPAYRVAYDALEDEFALIASLIAARTHAKLSQAEVATH